MKRWHCAHCEKAPGYADWEDNLTQSFCRMCGRPGQRLREFGCFACDDEGVAFWAPDAPSQPCPKCGSDCYKIIHAPYVVDQAKRQSFDAADHMTESALERQKVSLTTLKPERTPRQSTGSWVAPEQVMGRAAAGRMQAGAQPFSSAMPKLPRPRAIVEARDPRQAPS